MDKYAKFEQFIHDAAKKFKEIPYEESIRVISHLDADGISSASIIIKTLNRENRRYSISIVQQLDSEQLKKLAKENYKYFIFSDLGSGQISLIKKFLKDKQIFILDHHELEEKKHYENIIHVNPHFFDIDGSYEISGAGVCFLFALAINKKNKDLAHLAIIAAIADMQENNGFSSLNKKILDIAVAMNKIKVEKGLRFYGLQTRPLHKVLEYSYDPYIPYVSGSEAKAIQFLISLGINPKKGDKWITYNDLTEEEIKKLVAGIVMQRYNEENPEDVLGYIYTLTNEEEGTPLKDAREFATFLNACGRLRKASIGIGVCLNNKEAKRKVNLILEAYRKNILDGLKWVESNKQEVLRSDDFIIINAKDNIDHTIIGTIASILANDPFIGRDSFVLSMAKYNDGKTKVSIRVARPTKDYNLREILAELMQDLDAEVGGHKNAAGALINSAHESLLIEKFQQYIKKLKEQQDIKDIENKGDVVSVHSME